MRKLTILLSLFSSLSAFAGYNCEVETIQNNKLISTHTLTSTDGHINSGHLAVLNKERNKPGHKITLYLYGTISGWKGEEFLETVIYRNDFKYAKHNENQELTEKFTLKSNSSTTISFEDYEVRINCKLI